jgi:hypothetical protein
MAGLQTILNKCSAIEIDRRKVAGIQFTRNEIPRVSLTPTKNPWRFNLTMPASLQYYQNRDLLEALDTMDVVSPEIVTFSDNPCLSWIFAYQGQLNTSQLNGMAVQSFIGNQLVLTNLPVVPSTRIIFKPNDLIQLGNYPYPFTSTTQITRGTGSTITVTTNRPNILTANVVGLGITVGNACEWNMFCPNMPTYSLIPGAYVRPNGTVLNNALIQFSSDFQLYEYVGTS